MDVHRMERIGLNMSKPAERSRLHGPAGVLAMACLQGTGRQHGKPPSARVSPQPDAREGQAGLTGVADRLVVPLKPGNAGGGKGPELKVNVRRGEGKEIGDEPINSG